MEFRTETVNISSSVLIVSRKPHDFLDHLKKNLKRYGADVFLSPHAPISLERFDYCFFINPEAEKVKSLFHSRKKIIVIFVKRKTLSSVSIPSQSAIKVIQISGDDIRQEVIDRILWFAFSRSKERFLTLNAPNKVQSKKPVPSQTPADFLRSLNIKKVVFFLVIFFGLAHLIFFIPLFASSFMFYKSASGLKDENEDLTNSYLTKASSLEKIAERLYAPVRPTFLLFSLALGPDRILELNQHVKKIIITSISLKHDGRQVIKLFLDPSENEGRQREFQDRLTAVERNLALLENEVVTLSRKIPDYFPQLSQAKKDLTITSDTITKTKIILPALRSLLTEKKPKKYLLLFANNMELRPGGGFIGSFGILTVQNASLKNLSIYDVYDADGQLKAHIDPPEAIKDYLGQPHFFLRDSAFYPDFYQTYSKTLFFLDKEMGLNDFDGGALITTTAIENLLEAFGDVYLSDYKEVVNRKNFYLKAQLHSERNFFPGSTQKKSFLSSLTKHLMVYTDRMSVKKLLTALKKSFDEKQIVLYLEQPKIQDIINTNFWSGRMIDPKCRAKTENCVADYLYPLDANLGVNKANFFVSRSYNAKITFTKEGIIRHTLKILFSNDSPAAVFPGGAYKNYYQLILPSSVKLKTISKNGVLIEDYAVNTSSSYTTVGFLFEVPPKGKAEVKIVYDAGELFKKGRGIYQLIVQKQIGSNNNDFDLQFELPSGMYILNQNFSPLVKENGIYYNTVLSADKIFFIELIRE